MACCRSIWYARFQRQCAQGKSLSAASSRDRMRSRPRLGKAPTLDLKPSGIGRRVPSGSQSIHFKSSGFWEAGDAAIRSFAGLSSPARGSRKENGRASEGGSGQANPSGAGGATSPPRRGNRASGLSFIDWHVRRGPRVALWPRADRPLSSSCYEELTLGLSDRSRSDIRRHQSIAHPPRDLRLVVFPIRVVEIALLQLVQDRGDARVCVLHGLRPARIFRRYVPLLRAAFASPMRPT